MRIGIDIRCLTENHYSGISQYTLQLLNALFHQDKHNEYILFYNTARHSRIPDFPFPNVSIFKTSLPNKFFNASIAVLRTPPLDKLIGGVDIFFFPNLQFCCVSSGCPYILTVHDVSFLRYPQFYTWKARLWQKAIHFRRLCRKAKRIIAVSQNTRSELLHFFPEIPQEKISVIYSGISEKFRVIQNSGILDTVKKKYHLPENFILYLGNIEPRKNLLGIVEAFLQAEIPKESFLVIAGAPAWKYKKTMSFIKRKHERILFLGYIPEEDKAAIYNLAHIFIYPSFYEGFGFPPLEAMACGTPTIVSNISSLPEVTNNASILVDPYNIQEIATAISRLIYDQKLRETFIQRGLKHISSFQWQKTAMSVLKIFEYEKNH